MVLNDQDRCWPTFLTLLDSNPEEAARQFFLYAARLLKASPPRVMRSLTEDDRDDLIQIIVIHCVKNNFKVLREYTDQGKPFAAWFYPIARFRIIDYIRKCGRKPVTISADTHPDGETGRRRPATGNPGLSDHGDMKDTLDIVQKCMAGLDHYCRLLLRMAGDELKPSEMLRLLRWPAARAKKVSNDLRYCRRKLKNLVETQGVNIAECL